MTETQPVFIADTCIGGLSVVRSLWRAGVAADTVFLADYAVNPLGVKSDEEIAAAIDRWLSLAAEESDTLVLACNTLSLRYRELHPGAPPATSPGNIVTMVDFFEAMAESEASRLAGKRLLVIGTRYTANQRIYVDILEKAAPGIRVATAGATELERAIARLEPWDSNDDSVLTAGLRRSLGEADFAILACTCFPMAAPELSSLYPGVEFLDPGEYAGRLLRAGAQSPATKLQLRVTGDIVSAERAAEFARTYLDTGNIECCTWQ